MAQMVKRLPTVWETWVRSLGQEDPLEKEMATHSSTLAWKISWTGEHCRLRKESNMTERLHYYALSDFPGGSDGKASAYSAGDLGSVPGLGRSPGEGSNPLQYSCLPRPKKGAQRNMGLPW